MKRLCALTISAAFAMPVASAFAHGVVGQRTFIEPIVAEDANPKNEFDIFRPDWTKSVDGQGYSLGFLLEKKLSLNSSLTIASAWMHFSPHDPAAPTTDGFDNTSFTYKYAFLTLPEHEFRLSIEGLLIPSTGDPDAGAETHTRIGSELAWAWGWGDIPNRGAAAFLRPFAIQGDFGYTTKTGGAANDHLFFDWVLEYSIPYLSNFVRDVGLQWPLRNLIPYTELNFDEIVTGRTGQTPPDIRITPGIAYMDYYVEVSVATQLALNTPTVKADHANVIVLLDLFIDDIFPWTNWTPF